jgi:hypothetical protein
VKDYFTWGLPRQRVLSLIFIPMNRDCGGRIDKPLRYSLPWSYFKIYESYGLEILLAIEIRSHKLHIIEFLVKSTLYKQIFMSALLDYDAPVQNDNP